MKLGLRLLTPLVGFVSLIAATIAFFVAPHVEMLVRSWALENERSNVTTLAQSAGPLLGEANMAGLDNLIGPVWANRPDWGQIVVKNTEGTQIYPRGKEPAIAASLLQVSATIRHEGKPVGSLHVYFESPERMRSLLRTLDYLSKVVFAGGILMLIIAYVLQHFYVLRPIRRLSRSIVALAPRADSTSILGRPADELRLLELSFEDARVRLENRDRQLNATLVEANRSAAENLKLRTAAEQELRQRTIFVATISHEIRTPLAAIIGAIDLLNAHSTRDEDKTALGIARQSAQLLQSLVNDVLDFSRVSWGVDAPQLAPCDLPSLCSSIVNMVKAAVIKNHVALEMRIDPGVPRKVRTDAGLLSRALMNLVGNAMKFTDRGLVTLGVRAQPEEGGRVRLLFEIADTGIGIPEPLLNKVFEPFRQVRSEYLKPGGQGTGLGLTIANQIAKSLEGELSAKSRLGEGSTFTLSIPVEVMAVEPKQKVPLFASAHRPLDVLIAEDTPAFACVIKALVQRLGHRVQVVGDGEQAVAAYRENSLDVILMDVQMPVVNGLEATRQIRNIEAQKESAGAARIPIIGLSAFAQQSDVDSALVAGMSDYLTKPVNLEILRSLFERLQAPP